MSRLQAPEGTVSKDQNAEAWEAAKVGSPRDSPWRHGWSGPDGDFSPRVRVTSACHGTGRMMDRVGYACGRLQNAWLVIASRSDQHILISAVLPSSDACGARCIDITHS